MVLVVLWRVIWLRERHLVVPVTRHQSLIAEDKATTKQRPLARTQFSSHRLHFSLQNHSVLPSSLLPYIASPFSSVYGLIVPTPPRSSEPDAARPGSVILVIWFVLGFSSHLLRAFADKASCRRAPAGYQDPVQRWGDFQVAAAFVCSQTRQFSLVLPGGRQSHCLFPLKIPSIIYTSTYSTLLSFGSYTGGSGG
jgi:hypothetical protein